MAENKKSFLLYCDLIHTVDKLPNDKAGELFKHILMYVNDKNPNTEDLIIQLAFEPVKQQLKRDLVKYQEIKEKRKKAGEASAIKRQQMSTHVESAEQTSTNPTVNDTDNVTVNDNDTVIKKRNSRVRNSNPAGLHNQSSLPLDERIKKFRIELAKFQDKYDAITVLKPFFDYWTELNKSKTKLKFELERTWEMSKRLVRWVNNDYGNKKVDTPPINFDIPVKILNDEQ